ncbi:MAG: hypothetical protein RL701_5744 [Pseudomonadota bacterium]
MAFQSRRPERQGQTIQHAMRIAARVFGLCLVSALVGAVIQANHAHAQVIAGTSVYARTETADCKVDGKTQNCYTSVIAPRLHVGAPVSDTTRVDLVYTADVWSSASIDIRASASKRLTAQGIEKDQRPVIEQRDEINGTVTQEWNDVSLSGTYRYSHEYDYGSHGGILNGSYGFNDKNSTLEMRLSATFDQAGAAGDPKFKRAVTNLGARIGFTQLLDQQTFVQGIYELMSAHGYNSSPYRKIGIGTPDGLCGSDPSSRCIPEVNPNQRTRHALALNLRRALGEVFAFGVGYRLYLDSWSVMSHTALVDLSIMPSQSWLLALRYRFYLQGAAEHYRRSFGVADIDLGYYTNDKELSAFTSHRVSFDLEHSFELDAPGHVLTLVLSLAPSIFSYSNYAPLTSLTAAEVSLATVMKL